MKEGRTRIILTVLLAVILIGMFAEISQAAQWRYHARRNGWIVVFGTRNCRIISRPIRIQRVQRCHTYRGWLPWWCNDWMVWHISWQWPWPRPRVTRTKYIVRPCPRYCLRGNWALNMPYEWFEEYMPYEYGKSELAVPSFGYHEELSSSPVAHPDIYVLVDMSDWVEAATQPIPDPNTAIHFENGTNSNYPGITVAVGKDPFWFDPNTDPNGYPVKIKDTNDYFTGDLYLNSDQTFDSNESPGALEGSDLNYDFKVDLHDFAQYAEMYLQDPNAVPDPNSFIPDPNSFYDVNDPNDP